MKKLVFILMAVALVSTASCEDFDKNVWIPFQIEKGEHFSTRVFVNKVPGTEIRTELYFRFYFPDTTYKYDIGDNQSDWNKLFGITPFVNQIHEYSIRLAWRWLDDELQIGYYIYLPSDPRPKKGILTTTSYDVINNAYFLVTENFIGITVNDESFMLDAVDISSCPSWWISLPYFGGDEVAPHDINISLKCKYLTQCLRVQL